MFGNNMVLTGTANYKREKYISYFVLILIAIISIYSPLYYKLILPYLGKSISIIVSRYLEFSIILLILYSLLTKKKHLDHKLLFYVISFGLVFVWGIVSSYRLVSNIFVLLYISKNYFLIILVLFLGSLSFMDVKNIERFYKVNILIAILLCLFSLWQKLNWTAEDLQIFFESDYIQIYWVRNSNIFKDKFRAPSTFNTPLAFGAYLTLVMGYVLSLTHLKRIRKPLIPITLLLSGCWAVDSRGAQFSILVMGIVYFLSKIRKTPLLKYWKLLIFVPLPILLLRIYYRAGGMGYMDAHLEGYILAFTNWKVLFLGRGAGYSAGAGDLDSLLGLSLYGQRVESYFLQLLLDLGLPGFILFFGIIYYVYNSAKKISGSHKYYLLYPIIGLMTYSIFLHTFNYSIVVVPFFYSIMSFHNYLRLPVVHIN